MPNRPGDTAIRPPPTPLLAGSPVLYNHLPESSYKPAVAMTASTYSVQWDSGVLLSTQGIIVPAVSDHTTVTMDVTSDNLVFDGIEQVLDGLEEVTD